MKKSIGQFITALRKANGMTQQDVADRLNVSNKAVSRWERDECAPDISLIPALAEMFGVTCDELLKGERILNIPQAEKSEPKVEKQLKSLVNRAISSFKTLIWVSLALSAIGLICMFGISYGFYRPVIGFAVMLLFEAAAFAVAAIATNKMKEKKTDNELLENADAALINRFNGYLGTLSFIAFFATISVVALSFPLICFPSEYIDSVMTFESYFFNFFIFIALALALAFLKVKRPYTAWITNQSKENQAKYNPTVRKMNMIQLGSVALAAILFIIAPYFATDFDHPDYAFIAINLTGLACLFSNIICFIVFISKNKGDIKNLLLPGIRNILMIPAGFMFSMISSLSFTTYDEIPTATTEWERLITWNTDILSLIFGWIILVILIFSIIEAVLAKREK